MFFSCLEQNTTTPRNRSSYVTIGSKAGFYQQAGAGGGFFHFFKKKVLLPNPEDRLFLDSGDVSRYDAQMLGISLQSGSNGNCIYVEAGGVKLLFDAGISGKQALLRLLDRGRDIKNVDAMFISHDHTDHAKSAGIYQRKFGIDMYISQKTLAASRRHSLGELGNVHHFQPGTKVKLGGVTVETIPTPHDGIDPCMFVVQADGKRLGILTDLGHPFDGLGEVIASLDAVFLESNYDPDMLDNGEYPAFLKARIKSDGGHISNYESAALLEKFGRRLQWTCLAHLSEQNNTPQLAVQTHRNILRHKTPITVAPRYGASEVLRVD